MFVSGEAKGREESISYSGDVSSKIDERDNVSVVWIQQSLRCTCGKSERKEKEREKSLMEMEQLWEGYISETKNTRSPKRRTLKEKDVEHQKLDDVRERIIIKRQFVTGIK
jgi:hypothetical protein